MSLNDILGRLHNAKIDLDTGSTKAEVARKLSGILTDLRRIVEAQPSQPDVAKPIAFTSQKQLDWMETDPKGCFLHAYPTPDHINDVPLYLRGSAS